MHIPRRHPYPPTPKAQAKLFRQLFLLTYTQGFTIINDARKSMGQEGAQWPIMTELESGVNLPGDINALARPARRLRTEWNKVLSPTANNMASYPGLNNKTGNHDLGPASYGVTENTSPDSTPNLAYEIAYWRYGLDVAAEWKRTLGQDIPGSWSDVTENLALLPQVDGLYAVYQDLNSSSENDAEPTNDPPSLDMMQGTLPDIPAVDPAVVLRTADKVWEVWDDAQIHGWALPVLAINGAKIGNPERAICDLTAYNYWMFDDAGFAIMGDDGGTPPPFMPGSTGFLLAVGCLAAGWRQGSHGHAPGFPQDGSWIGRHEELMTAL